MQDIRELRETIAAILESQRLAVLATQGAARPHGSLVTFAAAAVRSLGCPAAHGLLVWR